MRDFTEMRPLVAAKLAELHAARIERRKVVYKLWCAGENDACAWCGMRFATLCDAVAIGDRLFHGFFCSERYAEFSAECITMTDRGRAALGDTWEDNQECRALAEYAEKRAMFRGGVTGCAVCGKSFADLSEASIEDGALVHETCETDERVGRNV